MLITFKLRARFIFSWNMLPTETYSVIFKKINKNCQKIKNFNFSTKPVKQSNTFIRTILCTETWNLRISSWIPIWMWRYVILAGVQGITILRIEKLFVELMNICHQKSSFEKDKLRKLTYGHSAFYYMKLHMVRPLLEEAEWIRLYKGY